MGMFDWYEPASNLKCPKCGESLLEWQGKDAYNALLVWREGIAQAVDQRVPHGVKGVPSVIAALRLPSQFSIYSYDCSCRVPVEANCSAVEGVWTSTVIVRPGAGGPGEPGRQG
jgi:hypothetical protein